MISNRYKTMRRKFACEPFTCEFVFVYTNTNSLDKFSDQALNSPCSKKDKNRTTLLEISILSRRFFLSHIPLFPYQKVNAVNELIYREFVDLFGNRYGWTRNTQCIERVRFLLD